MKKMSKLTKQQITVIVGGVILLVLVVVIGAFFLFGNKDEGGETTPPDPSEKYEIEPEVADQIYADFSAQCAGGYVWNLQVGDLLEIDSTSLASACQAENHYSKLVGYSYNDIGVTLYVSVLKNVNNSLYRIDDSLIGTYDENTLDSMLDQGTTYIYTFKETNGTYTPVQVEIMAMVTDTNEDVEVPEETVE